MVFGRHHIPVALKFPKGAPLPAIVSIEDAEDDEIYEAVTNQNFQTNFKYDNPCYEELMQSR